VTENEQQPFSEDAALRELEELQQKIEASRVRRKEANEAFDRFLHTFERPPAPVSIKETPPGPSTVPPPPSPPPVRPPEQAVQYLLQPPPASIPKDVPPVPSAPPAAPAENPIESSGVVMPPLAEPWAKPPARIEPLPPAFPSELPSDFPDALDLDGWDRTSASGVDAFPEESRMETPATRDPFRIESRSVPAALSMTGRSGKRIPPAAGVGAAVLVIAVVAFFALRGNREETPPPDQVAAEPPAAGSQPAAQPAPPPVEMPPQRAEISTLRPVWIRVMVDGQKVIERELPPNTHIPLNPVSQFVVRAGDAGAVRVAIEGKDQGPVGADGQVATKAFTVPPKAGQ
jgi:hypothetical protein